MAVNSLHLHVNGINYVVSGIPKGTSYKDVLCSIAKTQNDGLEKDQTLHYNDLIARGKGHEGRKTGLTKRKDSFNDSVKGSVGSDKRVRHPKEAKSPKGIKKDISHQQSKQTKHGHIRKQSPLKRRAMSHSSVRSNRRSMDDSDIEKTRQTNRNLANKMKRITYEDSDTKIYDNLVKLIGSQRKRIESQHKQLMDGRMFHKSSDFRKISFYYIDEEIEEIDREKSSSGRLVTNEGKCLRKSSKHVVGKGNRKQNETEMGVDNKAYRFTDDNDSGIPSGESEEASSRDDNRLDIRFKGFCGAFSQVEMKSAKSCPVLVSNKTELTNKAINLKSTKVFEAQHNVMAESKVDNVAEIDMNRDDLAKSIQVSKDFKDRYLQETRSEQEIDDGRNESLNEGEILTEQIEISDRTVVLNDARDRGEEHVKVKEKADLTPNLDASYENLSNQGAMMTKDCFAVLNKDTGLYSMKNLKTEDSCEGAESVEEATARPEQCNELANVQSSVTESHFSDQSTPDDCSEDCLPLNIEQASAKDEKCVSPVDRKIKEQNRGSFVLIDFDDFNDETRINEETSAEYIGNIDDVSIISLAVLDNIPELHAGTVGDLEEPEKEEVGLNVSQCKDLKLILEEVNSLETNKEDASLIGNSQIRTTKDASNMANQNEFQHKRRLEEEIERKEFELSANSECQSIARIIAESANKRNCRLENSLSTADDLIDRSEKKGNSKISNTVRENDENRDTIDINEASKQEHPTIKEDISNSESSCPFSLSTNERKRSKEEPEDHMSLFETTTNKLDERNFENSLVALKNDVLKTGVNNNKVVSDLVSSNSEKSKKLSWFRKKTRRTKIGRGIFEKEENKELINNRTTQEERSGEGLESKIEKTPVCDLRLGHEDINNNSFDRVVTTEFSVPQDTKTGLESKKADVSDMKRNSDDSNNDSGMKAPNRGCTTNSLNRKQFWKNYRQICDKIYDTSETLLYYDLLTEHRHFELKELLILQKSYDDDVLEKDETRVIREIKEFKNYLRSVTMFTKYQRDKILQNEMELQRIEEILARTRALFFSLEKCLWLKRFVHTPRLLLRKYNNRKFPGNVVTKRGRRQVIGTSSCRV